MSASYPANVRKGRLRIPVDFFARKPGAFPRMVELALVGRALGADARCPFRHVPRLGGVEAQAEAVADAAVQGDDAGDERLLSGRQAQGMDMNVMPRRHGVNIRFSRASLGIQMKWIVGCLA